MLIKEFLDTNPKNVLEPGYVFSLFPEKASRVYHEYVKKAAESLDLICESFIDFKHPGDALRDILARIQKAEILIFDISDFTPNVMWELGLALAIKDAERVIVIREKSDESLPFNIYSHRFSFQYDPNNEESLRKLYQTLREVMRKINKASSRKAPIQSPEVTSLLDNALKAVERKEWVAAEALFQTMDAREPNNWYIHNQWGIMHRSKGEFEAAAPKFNEALKYTDFEDEKAFICTEIAVLHQLNRRYSEAEEWFKKAEKADRENTRLYIARAEYYDELGDYFNAQAKIGGALAKIRSKEDDPNYEELMLRHSYYGMKIKNPAYTKSFEQFKREAGRPLSTDPPPGWNDNGSQLPYDVSWDRIVDTHVGTIVEGQISNITELGIFVRLSRKFTGLIFWKNLMEGFGEKFSKNQKIRVRINRALINARDQSGRIDLRLVDDQGEVIQPKPVLLAASAPRAVRLGRVFAVRFAAYVKRFEEIIEAQLIDRSLNSEAHLAITEARWQIGTRVKVRLSSPHLSVSLPQVEFVWRGNKEMVEFQVQAPSFEINTLLNFDISIGGISVARFFLELSVSSNALEEDPISVDCKPASTGFASYSAKDRSRVLDRIAELEHSGFDVFTDCLDLRPGEDWKPRLEEEIKRRERFYLFWSANAKKSKWVRWEWKTALKERGLFGIDPHPLDPVSEAKPPRELQSLNFEDSYMVLRKAYDQQE